MTLRTPADRKPACPDCELTLVCPSCTDPRPIAGAVAPGWTLLTPLGRWEDVVSAEQPTPFHQVQIRTKQSGAVTWQYGRTTKVEALPPQRKPPGRPEIRVVESNWRQGPIHAVACRDTDDLSIPMGAGILAAGFKSTGSPGWTVHIRLNTDGTTEKHQVPSKAAARTLVRGAGRRAARSLGVKLTIAAPA